MYTYPMRYSHRLSLLALCAWLCLLLAGCAPADTAVTPEITAPRTADAAQPSAPASALSSPTLTQAPTYSFQAANSYIRLVHGPQGDIFFVGAQLFDASTNRMILRSAPPADAGSLYF